jgi:phosphatidylserine/phosphatidylglycerophosphate/cardiolipin synthase-like enzyme
MAALAAPRNGNGTADIYVHSKVAVVDDAWATVGSANAMFRSWRGDTEMNASFWGTAQARALRARLFEEHLGDPACDKGARRGLQLFAEIARSNADRLVNGERLQGLAHAIDPATWVS